MNLFLLRHGIAVELEVAGLATDAARPLTPTGRRQLRHTINAWQAMALRCDVILSSPLVRARQTAEMAAKELEAPLTFAEELKPGGNVEKLVQKITGLKSSPKNVLLVGHEPDLSQLLSLLVAGQAVGGFALKKGGLARLKTEQLTVGKCATLAWLLTPAQMKLMA